jgi:hypothetical protein
VCGQQSINISVGYPYGSSVGTLAGENDSAVTDCTTSGTFSGTAPGINMGRLVGYNLSGPITNSYATASVSSYLLNFMATPRLCGGDPMDGNYLGKEFVYITNAYVRDR